MGHSLPSLLRGQLCTQLGCSPLAARTNHGRGWDASGCGICHPWTRPTWRQRCKAQGQGNVLRARPRSETRGEERSRWEHGSEKCCPGVPRPRSGQSFTRKTENCSTHCCSLLQKKGPITIRTGRRVGGSRRMPGCASSCPLPGKSPETVPSLGSRGWHRHQHCHLETGADAQLVSGTAGQAWAPPVDLSLQPLQGPG